MAQTKSNYITGLGDLYSTVKRLDSPTVTLFTGESVAGVTGVGTVTLGLDYTNKLSGTASLLVSNVVASEGVELSTAYDTGSASANGFIKLNIKPSATGNLTFVVNANSSANSVSITKAVVGGQWNEIVLDLANASQILPDPRTIAGTPDFTDLTSIEITTDGAIDMNIDNVGFYKTFDLIGNTLSVLIACISEFGIESSYERKEIRCSDNSLVYTTATSVDHKISLKGQDFSASAISMLANGTLSKTGVTKLDSRVEFTVGSSPNQITLTNPSEIVYGDGFGVWINTEDLSLIQDSGDPLIIPSGYCYINKVTGVVTFHPEMAGKKVFVTVNRSIPTGTKISITSDLTFKEATLQMKVKGSNGDVLFVFPRIIFDGGLSPETSKDDFWSFSSEGTILLDQNKGVYYEIHQNSNI